MNPSQPVTPNVSRQAPPACLQAAQNYLKRGWSTLALCPADHAGVDPAHQRICTTPGATPLWPWTDYQQRLPSERVLQILWNRSPLANVGLVLGRVSGLIALPLHGPAGEAFRQRFGELLPDTLEVLAPDGRRIILYALPERMDVARSTIQFAGAPEAIPCLGTGAYVILPPSRHAAGGSFTWRLGHSPEERNAAVAPPWLVDYLLAENKSIIRGPWSVTTEQAETTAEAASADSPALQPTEPAPVGQDFNPALARRTDCQSVLPHLALSRPAGSESCPTVPPSPVISGPAPQGPPTTDPELTPHLILLSDVKPATTHWLWPGRVPLGKLTVLDGDPGLGKSTLLLDLAARVTRGLALPDGAAGIEGGVTLLTAEDSLSDTVQPRLAAAGADLTRVRAFSAIEEKNVGNRPPVIPRDLDVLHRVLAETASRLLIIDPFLAYLGGGVDSCNDQDVRRCLHRLAELAEATQCAVLLLRHLNKLTGGKALYRGAGSIGIIGAARSGLLVARDPDLDGQRVLACTKSNLAALPASLRFGLEPAGKGVCRVAWQGESAYQADELINQSEQVEERLNMRDAKHFLRVLLAEGPVAADECLRQARAASISEKTLRRAKTRLGVQSVRDGEGLSGHWLWSLPPQS